MSKSDDAVAFGQGRVVRQDPTCVSRVKASGTRHGGAGLIVNKKPRTSVVFCWRFINFVM